jgi:hypothetical protein
VRLKERQRGEEDREVRRGYFTMEKAMHRMGLRIKTGVGRWVAQHG